MLFEASVRGDSTRKRVHSRLMVNDILRRFIRTIRTYKTTSTEALIVLARILPQIMKKTRTVGKRCTIECWKMARVMANEEGRIRRLIKIIGGWVDRKHGQLTQLLTGHWCFPAFLHSFNVKSSEQCSYWGGQELGWHHLKKWKELENRGLMARNILSSKGKNARTGQAHIAQ